MTHVITGRNVNSVYHQAVALVRESGMLQDSRAGRVLAVPEPVVLETLRPQERVLLDPQRDANPFFHFFESLWMLAGRQDSAFLDRFVRDFGGRFAEEDGTLHGAYGHRWRHRFHFDQLDNVITQLRDDPLDRQAVIAMWEPGVDTLGGGGWYAGKPLDIPCNTHIYPRIVGGELDLMVCCRSNDVVWGATGANAVHFAFLQEYLAGRIGVRVGTLRQMTTNLHGYVDVLERVGEPALLDPYDKLESQMEMQDILSSAPIGTDWDHWDEDLKKFLAMVEEGVGYPDYWPTNRWFIDVALPMWNAHSYWRHHNLSHIYMEYARSIATPDWQAAAVAWLERRAR